MKVFFYALFFHLTVNIYVFWRGWEILRNKKIYRNIFAALFISEFIIYLIGLFFHNQLPHQIIHSIALLGTTWMLFTLYMTLFLVIIDIIYFIDKRKPYLTERYRAKKTRSWLFIFSIFFTSLILMWGKYRFYHPSIVNYDITVHKKSAKIKSLKIVMAGDIHLGFLIDNRHAKRYVNLINSQKPDLILLVGDIIDATYSPIINRHMEEEMKNLRAPYGIYGCTGNHEYRYEREEKIRWLNHKAKIKMLRDSVALIDSSFYIIGREDRSFPNRKPYEEVMKKYAVDQRKPIIVLDHNPMSLDENARFGTDLALYGHTHDGQFFPGSIMSRIVYEVSKGYKLNGNTHSIVTSGLGLAGPQYRIGTQSEIVVINLKFTD